MTSSSNKDKNCFLNFCIQEFNSIILIYAKKFIKSSDRTLKASNYIRLEHFFESPLNVKESQMN